MNLLVIVGVGVLGGIAHFVYRERQRKLAVRESVRARANLCKGEFTKHFEGRVSVIVAEAVFEWFSHSGQGAGVDPGSDLFLTYRFDGDILEDCLDAIQLALRLSNEDYAAARNHQQQGLQTVEDLTIFVGYAFDTRDKVSRTLKCPGGQANVSA